MARAKILAQETFITAWRRLRHLRHPEKLKAWLCGILRNRIQKALRREGPAQANRFETLDNVINLADDEPLPSDRAITADEERILWRSLERIDGLYREPLILFYREHQSIETVATQLDLTEDAVKQRLARGRKLLQEEVTVFVEKALRRTAPTPAFTSNVLAALPIAAAPPAGMAAAAAKGAAAGKSVLWGVLLVPILSVAGGILAHWIAYRAAATPEERKLKKFGFIGMWTFVLGWCLVAWPFVRWYGGQQHWSDVTMVHVQTGCWWLYAMILVTFTVVFFRQFIALRAQAEAAAGTAASSILSTARRIALITGLYLCCFLGLVQIAWKARDYTAASVIAAGMVALGAANYYCVKDRKGVAAIQIQAVHVGLIWAAILAVLNWRLDSWIAALRQVDVTQINRLLPMWSVHGLTVALVFWLAVLLVMTRPPHTLDN